MTFMKEDYAVLGLKVGADFAEVKAKYRRLIKEYHPDRRGNEDGGREGAVECNNTKEKFIKVQAAFERIRKHHFQFNVKGRASSTVTSTEGQICKSKTNAESSTVISKVDTETTTSTSTSTSTSTTSSGNTTRRSGIQIATSSSQPIWGGGSYNSTPNISGKVNSIKDPRDTFTSLTEERNALLQLLHEIDTRANTEAATPKTKSKSDNDDEDESEYVVIGDNVKMSRGELRAHVKEALLLVKAKLANTSSADICPTNVTHSVADSSRSSTTNDGKLLKMSALARMKMRNNKSAITTDNGTSHPATANHDAPAISATDTEFRFKRCIRCGNVVHKKIKNCTSCGLNLDLVTTNFTLCKSRYE